jgi:hypothetical protein
LGVGARGREREREGGGGGRRGTVSTAYFFLSFVSTILFLCKCDVEPWGGRAKEEAKEVILTRVEREGGAFLVVGAVTCTLDT